jgi:hypothetical protein
MRGGGLVDPCKAWVPPPSYMINVHYLDMRLIQLSWDVFL